MHQTIRKVTEDLDRFKFNTALASLMEYSNSLNQAWERKGIDSSSWEDAIEKLLLMMTPLAPHISEELWERTGHEYSIHNQSLPEWDAALAADEEITLVVQVNGRLRDRIQVPASISEAGATETALASENVKRYTEGKTIAKVIYVPSRLVNIVAK
jgi:leucyl-tRNA synthetase